MAEKYSFTQERIDYVNSLMPDRHKKALKHFGYNKPIGEVNTTAYNTDAFKAFAKMISLLNIDETRKARITFDYDPDFAHCLLQINQSDELNTPAAD